MNKSGYWADNYQQNRLSVEKEIHKLIKSRLLPIHVALIQEAPADDFGWMSLGIPVDMISALMPSA